MRKHISVISVVVLVVACGGQTPSGTPAAVATSVPATAAPTAEPTPGPTQEPTSTPGLRWALPTVPEGWSTLLNVPRVRVMKHEDGTNLIIATELSGAGGTPLDPGAAAFVAYLESFEGLKVLAKGDVQVGELDAKQVDVRATVEISELFHIGPVDGPDGYVLNEGQPARILALDSRGETIAIVVEPKPGQTLQQAVATAQPVIDSIVFE